MERYKGFERVKEFPDKPIYKLDMKQFEPLFDLNRKLEYFDKLNLSITGNKKIEGMIFQLMNNREIYYNAFKPFNLIYRGRIFNPSNEDINNKTNFWYPKSEYVKEMGKVK